MNTDELRMVFEERLIVNTYEKAKNIAQYLKSERISSRIISEPVIKNQLTIAGTYDAIKAFLAGYPDHIRELYAKASDEEKALRIFENPDDEIWITLPELLESYHSAAVELLEGVNQGDFFCNHLSDILDGKYPTDPDTDYTLIARDLDVFKIFNMNEIIEVSTSGVTLSRKVTADDLIYYIPYDLKFPPDKGVFDEYQITLIRTFAGKIRYAVVMGAEVVLHEDYQILFYELAQRGIDTDAMFELMDRHLNKVRLTGLLVDAIVEDDVSLEVLKDLFFDDPSVMEGEGRIQDRSDYTPEYIEGVIADLRKIDVIKGRDQRLKPGRAINIEKTVMRLRL